jgi:hypothetical protein
MNTQPITFAVLVCFLIIVLTACAAAPIPTQTPTTACRILNERARLDAHLRGATYGCH